MLEYPEPARAKAAIGEQPRDRLRRGAVPAQNDQPRARSEVAAQRRERTAVQIKAVANVVQADRVVSYA